MQYRKAIETCFHFHMWRNSMYAESIQGVCFSLLSFLSPVEYSLHCRTLLFKKNLYRLHIKVNNEELTMCIEEPEWRRESYRIYMYIL